MASGRRILIIESQEQRAKALAKMLEELGFEVAARLSSGEELAKSIHQIEADLALVALRLPGEMEGTACSRLIKERWSLPVIYLADETDKESLRWALETNPYGFLLWPVEGWMLFTTIELSLYKYQLERGLRESEEKYRYLLEKQGEGIACVDTREKVSFCNPVAELIFGVKPGELMGKCLDEFTSAKDFQLLKDQTLQRRGGASSSYELDITRADGNPRQLFVTVTPLHDSKGNFTGGLGVFRDDTERTRAREVLRKLNTELRERNQELQQEIAERKKAEEKLRSSLEEKEVLLKEIHHRVKNNLQVVSSLLYLQSDYIRDKESQDVFRESQHRVRSMALVHEKLYQSRDLSRIDFREYIGNLVTHLCKSYAREAGDLALNLDLEQIYLDIGKAIPCGLIINELVTNVMKHAFPDGKKGELQVGFYRDKDNSLTLTVSDNGIGLPEEFDPHKAQSMGLRLVVTLTHQLDGELKVMRGKGTNFKISFESAQLAKTEEPASVL